MGKTYRVGVACMVHDHVWGELKKWQALPNVQLVAAGDINAPLREKIQREFGVPRVYESWREMLDKEELDIVQAASENATAADIVEAAAARGLHVVTEKPMSATLAQANRMVAAAAAAGVRLMVNWPTAWNPALVQMIRMIQEGVVGEPYYFKYRSAHNGPKEIGCSEYFWKWLYDEELNGAGALMDYCCYSADMCATLFGLPKQVTGIRGVLAKDYPIPDDNAIMLFQYDRVFGVAEASWTQRVGTAGPNPVCYGSEGWIGLVGGKLGNQIVLQLVGKGEEVIQPEALPAGRRTGPEYFISCLEAGTPIEGMCSPAVSRDAQEMLQAGLVSADEGYAVTLPLGG
ncbi:MAG: Gfo/Idh/MocA family oxidoreductase [Armatimonadota bacterium]|nr:Gfo/Idh/MocA family oxidoreductase [Armatimonadota bacterium]